LTTLAAAAGCADADACHGGEDTWSFLQTQRHAFDQAEGSLELSHEKGEKCDSTFTVFPFSQTDKWGTSYSGWEDCAGKEQSPINIISWTASRRSGGSGLNFTFRDRTGEKDYLKNSGYNLQLVPPTPLSLGKLTIDAVEYSLGLLHVHTPSEHAINWIRYALEMHIVGVSEDPDNKYAVMGILFTIGKANPCLNQLFPDPLPRAGCKTEIETVDLQSCFGDILSGSWWSFPGSFTTPPCTEGVKWNVLKKKSSMSLKQLMLIKTRYKNNARPPQPLFDRKVYFNKV